VTDTILCCAIFIKLPHSLHIYRYVFIFLHGTPSLRAILVRLLLLLLFLRPSSHHTSLFWSS
jgi:hypothetical protein